MAEENIIDKVVSKERSIQDSWKFISEVKRSVHGAFVYKQSRSGKFKTGRDRYTINFYDWDGELIQSHYAMSLVSKNSGADYMVCNVEPNETPVLI